MALASFQSLGRDPSCGDLLKILHEEGAITEAVSLSHLAGISSGPVALLASSALKKLLNRSAHLLLKDFVTGQRRVWDSCMETWPGMG